MIKSPWKLLLMTAALGLTVLLLAGAVWWWQLFQPISLQEDKKAFTVQPGTATKKIAEKLEDEGFIRSRYTFLWIVWRQQLAQKLQAGSFTLSANMKPTQIAQELTKGTNDVWVTIQEGWRATQIGEYLAQNLVSFDATSEAFRTECLAYEGYLFPETYLVPKLYSTSQMCQLMRKQFESLMSGEESALQASALSEAEVVTLASIVEREAKAADDMKMVAGILLNRLEIGMPLQVDATLQYIKGYNQRLDDWWAPPLAADKSLDSPYNTYQNAGLPPGPISNPGKKSLQAVLHPTPSNYLYYISSSDGSSMHYAQTYEEHQRNINLYLR